MIYQGSKARIVGEILPIMLKDMHPGQTFVDGFCGGCSVIQDVPQEYSRIANDNNRYLIAMWRALTTTDWIPPTYIPKAYYKQVRESWHKDDGAYPDSEIGWVGFMASWNGRFFDGGYSGHSANGRDYISENILNTMRQIDRLRGVEWQTGSYEQMVMPPSSLVYYDPPYKGTSSYATAKGFDHYRFYDWTRQMKRDGHTVYVSEYQMPGDFSCVWQKQITNSVNLTKTYKPTERLWTL